MTESDKYWERMSKNIQSQSQTYNKNPDISPKDAQFIKNYVSLTDEVIDIGSGSGLIVNKILPFVKEVTAVETFKGLSKYIITAPNVLVINARLEGFSIRKEYDVALSTGVMQFFERKDAVEMYTNIFNMVKNNGLFIMRIHCGLKETVVIHHSKELNQEYFAQYRQVDEEKKLLEEIGFSEVQVLDEAPTELNVWENTRHFMFICKK